MGFMFLLYVIRLVSLFVDFIFIIIYLPYLSYITFSSTIHVTKSTNYSTSLHSITLQNNAVETKCKYRFSLSLVSRCFRGLFLQHQCDTLDIDATTTKSTAMQKKKKNSGKKENRTLSKIQNQKHFYFTFLFVSLTSHILLHT